MIFANFILMNFSTEYREELFKGLNHSYSGLNIAAAAITLKPLIMKKFILLLFAITLVGCSTQSAVKDDTRTVREKVVVVKTGENFSIISSGRYDNWYKIDSRLNEGMTYAVTLEIPRRREKTAIITANLVDFTPGEYMQRDIFGKYIMAYNQLDSSERQ